MALVALQRTDEVASATRDAVAQKIIELAKAGVRDPEQLCDEALKAMQPLAPVLISDPQSSSASPSQRDSLNFEPVRYAAGTMREQPLRSAGGSGREPLLRR